MKNKKGGTGSYFIFLMEKKTKNTYKKHQIWVKYFISSSHDLS